MGFDPASDGSHRRAEFEGPDPAYGAQKAGPSAGLLRMFAPVKCAEGAA